MLVLHPQDEATAVMSALYEGTGATCINPNAGKREVEAMLCQSPANERMMLLGRGTGRGLIYRNDALYNNYDRNIVGHAQAGYLRRHGNDLIGIWCNADKFARREGLHGLFSGVFITDKRVAEEYGIITLQCHIDEVNTILFRHLRKLLDEGCPLPEIPEQLRALNQINNFISSFNLEEFCYL